MLERDGRGTVPFDRGRTIDLLRWTTEGRILLSSLALFAIFVPQVLLAAETALPITPAGGTDLAQALLPPPGVYAAVANLPINENSKFYDKDGNVLPHDQTPLTSIPITAVGLTYVFPKQIVGGSVAIGVQIP